MDPQTHFLFPFFIALILTKLNILSWKWALFCGLIGVLIDLDHYVEYILHSKSNRFSLKKMWNNAMRFHRFNERSFIHYWRGFLVLSLIFLVVLFFNWRFSLILVISYYSHLLLDYLPLKKFLRWKIGEWFVKVSFLEIVLDIVLVLGIIILIFVPL